MSVDVLTIYYKRDIIRHCKLQRTKTMTYLEDTDRPEGCRAVVVWGERTATTPGTDDAPVDSMNNAVTAVCSDKSFGPRSYVLAKEAWDGMTRYGTLSPGAQTLLGAACLNCPKKIS